MTEETIFEVALEMQSPAERSAYLDQACGGDLELRRRVELLLEANANLGDFLERPVPDQLAAAPSLLAATAAAAHADGGEATGPLATLPDERGERIAPIPGRGEMTDWAVGLVILDDFVVERELGKGGMGKVYLVRSRSTGQQFAVKRALLRDDATRRNFLAELRTWIDLPEHPHLVACRFFRTVEDEVVIFAEFVDGGSLATVIQQRRLTSLEQILDAAIQFAWGLHAAHEHGLVHQDVKPGNILVTGDGMVKVGDFGLARVRVKVEGQASGETGQSILVSCRGMTRAYCSPEQWQGRPLSRRTDIWSWGLCVLEMFTGKVTWSLGTGAAEVLDAYFQGPPNPDLPVISDSVAEVLRKCFRREPAERWTTLAEAAEALQRAHQHAVGQEHERPMPSVHDRTHRADVAHDRRTNTGVQWIDPREWLVFAYKAEGRDPAQVEASLSSCAGSRKAQAIADLEAYEKARPIFERLAARKGKHVERLLAGLWIQTALIHQYLDDLPGALVRFDQGIGILEQLVKREGRLELADELAQAYANKAIIVRTLGDNPSAVSMYDQAISIYERQLKEGRKDVRTHLAKTYTNKATALCAMGDKSAAVDLFGRALEIYEGLVEREGCQELENDLARTCMNLAVTLRGLGNSRAALPLCDRAISIRERLVHHEGHPEWADNLARAYMNKANVLTDLGDKEAAADLCGQAVALFQRLVEQEGRQDLAKDLAQASMNLELIVGDQGDEDRGYERSADHYKRLVVQEGRRELTSDWALACMNSAIALSNCGDKHAAAERCSFAVDLFKRLVLDERRWDLANQLARAYQQQGTMIGEMGDTRGAVEKYGEAEAILKRLVEEEERRELAGDWAWAALLRAKGLLELDDRDQAQQIARKALPILKDAIAQTGRADLQIVLEGATKDLREVL